MSIGAIKRLTDFFNFNIINFDFARWAAYEESNWDRLDAVLAGFAQQREVKGAWAPSTAYVEGDRVLDVVNGTIYINAVAYTSGLVSFSADRTAHPTYWIADSLADNSVTLAKLFDITGPTVLGKVTGTGDPELLTPAQLRTISNLLSHGQCILTLSGGNLTLSPYGGNKLLIDGIPCTVTTVTLAPSGLAPGTDYFIYARDANGDGVVDTLEASTTVPVLDSSTGVQIKTGDTTRSLVGWARPTTGPLFIDTPIKRFVRTWFNRERIPVQLSNAFSTTKTSVVTAAFAEVDISIRVEFLAWANEIAILALNGYVFNNGAFRTYTGISFDGGTPESGASSVVFGTNGGPPGVTVHKLFTTNGYHFATLAGVVAGGQGSWEGSGSGVFTTLQGGVR